MDRNTQWAGSFFYVGCGLDLEEVIEALLHPWSISFDSNNQMYFVNRNSAASQGLHQVWKLEDQAGSFTWVGWLLSGKDKAFSPWGLDLGVGAGTDILFLTDMTAPPVGPRLLAVSRTFVDDTFIDDPDILLAQALGINPQTFFKNLRGLAALPLPDGEYRVFVAHYDDGTAQGEIYAFDYDIAAQTFTYRYTITSPGGGGACQGFPFDEPYDVAVDQTSLALYVIDFGSETLFRFDGINNLAPPTCTLAVKNWIEAPPPLTVPGQQTHFYDPSGVDVVANYIVVADSGKDRVVAFDWMFNPQKRHFDYIPTNLPPDFKNYNASPLGVAFDINNKLWITYPAISAVGGEE